MISLKGVVWVFTSRNVNIYDDLVVTFRLFVMEVVSTMTNFITSSQITSDGAKPLKIMTKLGGWSPNNKPVSSQMNLYSSAHEEPMPKANWRHKTTTLSSQNNLKKDNKDLVPHATTCNCGYGSHIQSHHHMVPHVGSPVDTLALGPGCGLHQCRSHMWATISGPKFTKNVVKLRVWT
jgi:hypothetical protein